MKTITLRIDESTYDLFSTFAHADNRPISNLIETAAKKHIEECLFASEAEMQATRSDKHLMERLKLGSRDAKNRRGRFVE